MDREMKEEAERIRTENQAIMKKEREEAKKGTTAFEVPPVPNVPVQEEAAAVETTGR